MDVAGCREQGAIDFAGLTPHCVGLLAVLLAGCEGARSVDRTIIDQAGSIAGEATVRQSVQLQAGDQLFVVLAQSGVDLQLSIEDPTAHIVGRFDSQTGRHGQERAVANITRSGEYVLAVSATLPSHLSGSYRITAITRSGHDRAEEDYSRASDLTANIDYRERIELFESAARAFAASGRRLESGLASLAATTITVTRLSDAARSAALGMNAVRAFRDTHQSGLLADALAVTAGMIAERNLTNEVPRAQSRAQFEPMLIEARNIHLANDFSVGVAETNLYLGVALGAAGFGDEAVDLWESSRSACHDIGEIVCEGHALGSLGTYAGDVPDYPSSFAALYRAASLLSGGVDRATLAEINVNLAFVLGKVNHHDEAIARHRMALREFEAAGECVGVSRAQYGIGYSLLGVGDYDQATWFFRQALDRDCRGKNRHAAASAGTAQREPSQPFANLCANIVADKDQDYEVRKVAMWSAWDLGNLARSRGDLNGAAACHGLAAQVAPTENTRLGTKLERIEDFIIRGDAQAAQKEFAQLDIDFSKEVKPRDGGHAWYLAHAREVWARLLLTRGATEEAFAALKAADEAYRERGNEEGRFDSLRTLGQLAQQAGEPQQSADYFSQADGVLESFRIATLNPSHRAMLLDARRSLYREWIGSVSAAPHEEMLGLLISERSRSRILTELANSYVIDAQEQKARMQSSFVSEKVGTATEANVRPLFWEQTAQSKSFDAAARRESRTALLSYQHSIETNTTVVEYLLGQNESDAWVMRRDALHRVKLPGVAAIDKAARSVHASLSGNADLATSQRALGELYRLVVAPLAPYIAGDALIVAADDVLYGVPFAALWDEDAGQYLVQRMSISMIPSLQFSIARRNAQRPPGGAALLVGDPVYEPRDAQRRCAIAPSNSAAQNATASPWRRIPASAREVDDVAALLRSRDLEADVLVGCAATREEVIARLPRRYRILHFATHATADAEVPERSAVHLAAFNSKGSSSESRLSAADLFEQQLDADLVVLSGCSSAGGRRFAADGTMGLTFSALAAGGRNVVSSLWPIADEATVLVMQTFYGAHIRDKSPPNEALRRAQLALLEQEAWRHPRYWAGYILTGG